VTDISSLIYANMRQYPLNMYLWPTTGSRLPHNALHPPSYSAFPSSCNIRLQEREPCHPIKLQKDLNSALWLAHTVDAVATGSCKNLEKRCSLVGGGVIHVYQLPHSHVKW